MKTEMQLSEREAVISLNIILNFKSKHIIKGPIVQIDRNLGKPTFESNLSEESNI